MFKLPTDHFPSYNFFEACSRNVSRIYTLAAVVDFMICSETGYPRVAIDYLLEYAAIAAVSHAIAEEFEAQQADPTTQP